jgi:SAM-dependent methyltransferase
VPDPIFSEPRLAEIYDALDGDRSDLVVYLELVAELNASTILDVGCGTGTFACLLAQRGIAVVGVDPAEASLRVARAKIGASTVHWIHGDATNAAATNVDLALMTGNVAQVFLTDVAWHETLRAVHRALRGDGWLVFETRNPASRAWEMWTHDVTYRKVDVAGIGPVTTWTEVVHVALPFVTFRHVFRFAADNAELESLSTLRFRSYDEIVDDLQVNGFDVVEVRDAPDRPDKEFVFLARKALP